MYSNIKESEKHSIHFVSAFDELYEQNRKMFNVPGIDNFLSFLDKKNICIVNRSTQNTFLYRLITNVCLYFKDTNKKICKTILIDAGSGNNLHHIYLNIIGRSSSSTSSSSGNTLANVNNILDNIIIARAFTFYQLANIIIEEIPRLIDKLDTRLQIIILDLQGTLFSSSSSFSCLNKKYDNKESSPLYNNDFQNNLKLLEEMIDGLVQISKRYFVILSFIDCNKLFDNNNKIFSKFNNILEIEYKDNKNIKKIKDKEDLIQIRIKSKNNNANRAIPIKDSSISNNKAAKITEFVK